MLCVNLILVFWAKIILNLIQVASRKICDAIYFIVAKLSFTTVTKTFASRYNIITALN